MGPEASCKASRRLTLGLYYKDSIRLLLGLYSVLYRDLQEFHEGSINYIKGLYDY